MRKIAIIFPGIGYHCDKPLLYYGKKLAVENGYEIIEVPYKGFQSGIKGNAKLMYEAFQLALTQTEEILGQNAFDSSDQLLLISKSIGTAVAAAYEKKHGIKAKNIYFTPVAETFQFMEEGSGIVFHGTGDSWANTESLVEECEKRKLPYYLTEKANHSMENGNVVQDLQTLQEIMKICEKYIGEE
ncbi:MAG: alpha/beta hydrolase [Eubacteriales bacterium]|nr:alpha/beta hydrolase [Eubacteriales bacterium]